MASYDVASESSIAPWLGRIHHGNCLDIMAQMPSESIKVIVTSPPYNLKNSTGNGMKDGRGGKWVNAKLQDGYDRHDDAMPHDDYVAWQRDCLGEMMRLLRPDGAIFYNHKWRVQKGLMQDRQDIVEEFPVRQIIIWERSGGINFNPGYFLPNYEVIYFIPKPEFKLAPKANAVGCVWKFHQEFNNDHPAPFPFELADRCVKSAVGGENCVVLDPFMGSGTTALAAIASGVEWVGIDVSRAYIDMAEARISDWFASNSRAAV
ncbi:MAG: site-specific DNA-methyltransferase [Acidimicrobiia bacterium]|nr:site-specific DNA-methyltransferase [Acidimicrobiia bacterium]MYC57676.1 site-specific DNA-methyltransferase [Acidimicrobiia bacterium]MYG93581.1 site-specific DNA-methyltransferase [Acidimicrobiia bacterium]MYI31202.1 site-specific DNA-methyltransferase [Acidimicrobiia bacterium]